MRAGELDASEDACIGFLASIIGDARSAQLWLHADESGAPEHVARFVRQCAEAFQLHGQMGLAAAQAREVEAAERALLNRLQARYQPERAPIVQTTVSPAGDWASDQPTLL